MGYGTYRGVGRGFHENYAPFLTVKTYMRWKSVNLIVGEVFMMIGKLLYCSIELDIVRLSNKL